MATDQWLALKAALSPGTLVVRLYRWEKPAYTIGLNQEWSRAMNLARLRADELAIRRITGGRAIFHTLDELTYSVTLEAPRGGGDFDGARARIVSGLIGRAITSFLLGRGISATMAPQTTRSVAIRTASESPHCFASVARHEVTRDGVKVAAGAQRLLGRRFFQHGSIKINGAQNSPALFEQSEAPSRHCPIVGSPEIVIWSTALARDFQRAMSAVFAVTLAPYELTNAERSAIEDVMETMEVRRGHWRPTAAELANLSPTFLSPSPVPAPCLGSGSMANIRFKKASRP